MTSLYTVHKTTDITAGDNEILLPISRTDGKKGKSGICIKVNTLSDAVLNVIYADAIGSQFLRDCIDDVRSKVASSLHKAGKEITSDRIGVTALLDAMKASVESQRFTKEAVKVWFDTYLATALGDAIESRFHGISSDKLLKMVNDYCDAFQSLASRSVNGKYEMKVEIRNGLLRVLELLPEDHDTAIGNEIATRLDKTIEPQAMALALGF